MITTTFIPAGQKLPVIAVIAGFLMGGAWWAAPVTYFAGITLVIVSCIIMKKWDICRRSCPICNGTATVPYSSAKRRAHPCVGKGMGISKKAGTILFLCCVVMWFLGSFGIQDGAFGLVDTQYCFWPLSEDQSHGSLHLSVLAHGRQSLPH